MIQNPAYYIRYGNELIKKTGGWRQIIQSKFKNFFSKKNEFFTRAEEAFSNAITLEPELAYIAYYKKAFTIIYEREKQKDEKIYKSKAIFNLEAAADILETRVLSNLTVANGLSSQFNNDCNELNVQNETKLKIHQHLFESIKNSIKLIEKSQKLFSIHVSSTIYNRLSNTLARDILTKKTTHIKEEEKLINLEFPYLKVHCDIWTDYETSQIIKKTIQVVGQKNFNGIDINFKNIDKDKLKLLPKLSPRRGVKTCSFL